MNLLVIQCLIGVQFTGTGSLLIRNSSAVQHNHFIITCLFLIQGYSWRQRFWRGTCTHSWDEWRSTPRPSPPIHPRPSSVISCDSELSPLQAGWLIDQFNQTYMWKLCKTFALSMPVRQLSWQEKSFSFMYHPSLLAVFSLDVFVERFSSTFPPQITGRLLHWHKGKKVAVLFA